MLDEVNSNCSLACARFPTQNDRSLRNVCIFIKCTCLLQVIDESIEARPVVYDLLPEIGPEFLLIYSELRFNFSKSLKKILHLNLKLGLIDD